mmetsp:Transcript_40911/g.80637  ORF Transcript_40911/g.80637 Transcript_40911/m.80637 type:complete len:206 (+) Transcript_40911:239-856(+)
MAGFLDLIFLTCLFLAINKARTHACSTPRHTTQTGRVDRHTQKDFFRSMQAHACCHAFSFFSSDLSLSPSLGLSVCLSVCDHSSLYLSAEQPLAFLWIMHIFIHVVLRTKFSVQLFFPPSLYGAKTPDPHNHFTEKIQKNHVFVFLLSQLGLKFAIHAWHEGSASNIRLCVALLLRRLVTSWLVSHQHSHATVQCSHDLSCLVWM